MSNDHDDWVKVAMADDSLVVDILLRLRLHPPPPSLNLHWTVRRQRRSRSTPRHNKSDSTRASPTTPLSWTSHGYDHSNRPTQSSISKVANPGETATTRKTRRKKTLAELKEEEDMLLKERRHLKKKLASLRLNVEKHRATNESIKRMKLDFESQKNSSAAYVSGPSQFVKSECHPSNSVSLNTVIHGDSPVDAANASTKAQDIGNQESTFVLPDLNLPVDEDISANIMH